MIDDRSIIVIVFAFNTLDTPKACTSKYRGYRRGFLYEGREEQLSTKNILPKNWKL